jgi:type I restriction enzyme S subunit
VDEEARNVTASGPRIETRLDRVATVNARIGWKALTASEYQDEGYAFLSTPNIKGRSIDFENVNYISEFRYRESPELMLQRGDVLLAKDGNTLGIVNIVGDLPRPATVNGSIAVLRPTSVEPRFLRYWLESEITQARIAGLKDGMGVPHLFQRDINRLPVSLPDFAEQSRIADLLDEQVAAIDEIAARRARQIDLVAESLRSRIGHEVQRLMEERGDAALGRFLSFIEQGGSPLGGASATDGDVAVIKTSAIREGYFVPDENKVLLDPDDFDPRYEIRHGDVLVVRGSGSEELVADAALVRDSPNARLMLSDLVYRLRGLSLDPGFAVAMLLSPQGRSQIRSMVRQGSGPAKARAEDIKSVRVPILDGAHQASFSRTYWAARSDADAVTRSLQMGITALQEFRRVLVTDLVSGARSVEEGRIVVLP